MPRRHILIGDGRLYLFCIISLVLACETPPETGFSSGKGGLDTTMPFECSGMLLRAFPEACNGLDDDCDGITDEGLSSCAANLDELPFRLCSSACCVDDLACGPNAVCHRLGEQGRCEPPCEDGEFRLCSFGCALPFSRVGKRH